MGLEVKKLTSELIEDFFALHSTPPFNWCCCVAWEVPGWEGWAKRTAEDNRNLRKQLFDQGRLEGYLLYLEGKPVGWCQCGPRDNWHKLVDQYHLKPDPEVYALTCFCLLPRYRKLGLTHRFLAEILKDLQTHKVKAVQAFPRKGTHPDEEVWTGPEGIFTWAGFILEKDDPIWPVLKLEL
ncbi:MAG: GNAT family N-acetyltransferase [candidate division Zixibacteria bacterium]|nr:GNAT family N-acetyltransferase [candidate division Zixibacteria bacterium]